MVGRASTAYIVLRIDLKRVSVFKFRKYRHKYRHLRPVTRIPGPDDSAPSRRAECEIFTTNCAPVLWVSCALVAFDCLSEISYRRSPLGTLRSGHGRVAARLGLRSVDRVDRGLLTRSRGAGGQAEQGALPGCVREVRTVVGGERVLAEIFRPHFNAFSECERRMTRQQKAVMVLSRLLGERPSLLEIDLRKQTTVINLGAWRSV